jgi:hypothetical protein
LQVGQTVQVPAQWCGIFDQWLLDWYAKTLKESRDGALMKQASQGFGLLSRFGSHPGSLTWWS